MANIIGWTVGWPNQPRAEWVGVVTDVCGYGMVVAAVGDHLIVRVSDEELQDGEPSYCISLCLHDDGLRFFKTEPEYHAFIAYQRRAHDEDHLHDAKPQGSA